MHFSVAVKYAVSISIWELHCIMMYLYEIYPVVLSVRFTEREYNVTEGEGVMTVGIELNRPSPQRITVRLVITENTAEG